MEETGIALSKILRDPNGEHRCDFIIALTHSRWVSTHICASRPQPKKSILSLPNVRSHSSPKTDVLTRFIGYPTCQRPVCTISFCPRRNTHYFRARCRPCSWRAWSHLLCWTRCHSLGEFQCKRTYSWGRIRQRRCACREKWHRFPWPQWNQSYTELDSGGKFEVKSHQSNYGYLVRSLQFWIWLMLYQANVMS